jgi:hypothetical protein
MCLTVTLGTRKKGQIRQLTTELRLVITEFFVQSAMIHVLRCLMVWFMVFNATFNNISVILWWSVLLVEET